MNRSVNRNHNINRNANVNRNRNINKNANANVNRNRNVNKNANINRNRNVNKNANVNRNRNANKNVNVNRNVGVAGTGVVRGWTARPYFGTAVGGIVLGSIITAAAVGAVPPSPDPSVCWFWTDDARTQGYWAYCEEPRE